MADMVKAPNLDAARSEDRLTALKMLRDTLAVKLDTTTADVHSSLASQYRATLLEIDELVKGKVPDANPGAATAEQGPTVPAAQRWRDRVGQADLAPPATGTV